MKNSDPDNFSNELFRLEELLSKQQAQLDELKRSIEKLKSDKTSHTTANPPQPKITQSTTPPPSPFLHSSVKEKRAEQTQPIAFSTPVTTSPTIKERNSDMESFIGQRIASLIGIAVLVVGIAFGIKYAIDANLITPASRVIFGFLAGAIMVTVAYRIRVNYKSLSAVILSGGLAVLYYSCFAGFHYYQLYSKGIAFGLMTLLTIFGVISSLVYNLQIIGILGLTGAYAVPFLLSDGSGEPAALFTYMTLINAGILYLTFKKNWKLLENVAFYLTWFIFTVWYVSEFPVIDAWGWGSYPYPTAILFSGIFFLMFYLSILIRTVRKPGETSFSDILRTGSNGLLFFLIAGHIVDAVFMERWTGLFSIGNAVFHFVLATTLFRNNIGDKRLLYTLLVLVITFVTISVPIQLDGPWVTLFWGVEGLLLFWIGRKKLIPPFTTIGSLLIIPMMISLVHDWESYYNFSYFNVPDHFTLLFNGGFFTSIFSGVVLLGFYFMSTTKKLTGEISGIAWIIAGMLAPVLGLLSLYLSGYFEISAWMDVEMVNSAITTPGSDYQEFNFALQDYRIAWLNIYSLAFFTGLCFIQPAIKKSVVAGWTISGLCLMVALISLFNGLDSLSDLREAWLFPGSGLFKPLASFTFINYFFYLAFIVLVIGIHYNSRKNLELTDSHKGILFFTSHLLILVVLSHLVTHLFMISATEDIWRYESISYRVGYSILWAVYSFILIGYGMLKEQLRPRIAGFILLGVTVIKLLLMDTSNLPVLARVVAFMAVGVLLLLVSWLYYRKKSGKEDER